ncbi:hypothetical protein FOZ76_13220 [Verticiella sediminum]|uniref:Uncharacterized protein n=1 Tax=Verticiella sediminum TaxID=1247510 RepID=A0A556ALV4_9BURK|nr:hypothetical protein [Verticiella sediminum]TSH93845.1 hypothetical protein FOZ76_13220 [Verticiella sediminum]
MRLPSTPRSGLAAPTALAALLAVGPPALAEQFRLGVDYSIEGTLREGSAWEQVRSGNLQGRLGTRLATPWGEVVQSGVTRYDSLAAIREVWRDQAYWQYTDPATQLHYRAGDFRAGTSLGWVRSYDMTGIQVRRSSRKAFDTVEALTPDPALLRNVDPGTFSANAMPALPPMDGSDLLGRGATEYGAQAGYLRLDPGSPNARYAPVPMASAGLRYGLAPALTAESYSEAAGNLLRQGAGLVGRMGGMGYLGVGASYSRDLLDGGAQFMATYRGGDDDFGYFAGTQLRSDGFQDGQSHVRTLLSEPGTDYSRIDTVGVAWQLSQRPSRFRFNYVRLTPSGAPVSRLVNLTHATEYDGHFGWYTSVYRDIDDGKDFGMYVGVQVPLGKVTRSQPGPAFDFRVNGAPASLRSSVGSATVGSTGSLRLDQGVRVHTGLYDSYLRETL